MKMQLITLDMRYFQTFFREYTSKRDISMSYFQITSYFENIQSFKICMLYDGGKMYRWDYNSCHLWVLCNYIFWMCVYKRKVNVSKVWMKPPTTAAVKNDYMCHRMYWCKGSVMYERRYFGGDGRDAVSKHFPLV